MDGEQRSLEEDRHMAINEYARIRVCISCTRDCYLFCYSSDLYRQIETNISYICRSNARLEVVLGY